MGVDYYCDCVIGVKLSVKEIEKVISQPVYEDQKRYDTKTGLVSHVERVLVKDKEVKYCFGNLEFDDLWGCESYKDTEPSKCRFLYDNDNNEVYFGHLFTRKYQPFTCADVSLLLEDLVATFRKVGEKIDKIGLDQRYIKIYVIPSVSY